MSTIIKLQRKGTVHKPFWRVVVTDSRKPKGCVEQIGTYDNLHKPVKLDLNRERAAFWLSQGALPTLSVKRLLQQQGVLKPSAREAAGTQA